MGEPMSVREHLAIAVRRTFSPVNLFWGLVFGLALLAAEWLADREPEEVLGVMYFTQTDWLTSRNLIDLILEGLRVPGIVLTGLINLGTGETPRLETAGRLLLMLLTGSLAGLAICRREMLRVGGSVMPPGGRGANSVLFAARRLPAVLFAVGLPLIVLAVLYLVAQFWMSATWWVEERGMLKSGLLFLSIATGMVAGAFAVLVTFAWSLMTAGIAAEDLDGFDAFSRSFSYSLNRVFLSLKFVFGAAVVGTTLTLVLARLAETVFPLYLSTGPTDDGESFESLYYFVSQESDMLAWPIVAVLASFFWNAAARAYLALRLADDGVAITEVRPERSAGEPSMPIALSGLPRMEAKNAAAGEEAAQSEPGR